MKNNRTTDDYVRHDQSLLLPLTAAYPVSNNIDAAQGQIAFKLIGQKSTSAKPKTSNSDHYTHQ